MVYHSHPQHAISHIITVNGNHPPQGEAATNVIPPPISFNYITEDGSTHYVVESGTQTPYVTEDSP